MIALSRRWTKELGPKPETGMGYQVVSIVLKDGRRFDRVVIDSGFITQVKGLEGIPFVEDEIDEIILTHDKWDFDKE